MHSAKKGLTVGVWLLAALCATVWAELDHTLDKQWDLWKSTHQKKYQNEVEELGRRALWERKLKQINHHNLEKSLGLHSYTLGMNHMSDLMEDEISKLNGFMLPENFTMTPTPLETSRRVGVSRRVGERASSASVDWRQSGYVTSVKDQTYQCHSSWAFSAAGALEGLWFKKTGTLVDLSPQNLMDCSKPYGSFGCQPGNVHNAFQYVMANNGIDSEAAYPYMGRDGFCLYNPNGRAATCSSYHFVPKDELSLQKAVETFGPISAAIYEDDLVDYSSGVYNNPSCGKNLNHAVLVVGYGTDTASGRDYWLIKNSRGPAWGENGYIRLARNANQMCGISLYAVYPQ